VHSVRPFLRSEDIVTLPRRARPHDANHPSAREYVPDHLAILAAGAPGLAADPAAFRALPIDAAIIVTGDEGAKPYVASNPKQDAFDHCALQPSSMQQFRDGSITH
jgi:hypothetical protein